MWLPCSFYEVDNRNQIPTDTSIRSVRYAKMKPASKPHAAGIFAERQLCENISPMM